MHDLSQQAALSSIHQPDAAVGVELYSRIGREWPLFKHLKDVLRIPIKDLRLKEAGGSGAYLVISLKKEFVGQVRQLMYGAWSQRTGFGKITVVVDDDIDVWDDFAVDWALSWHVRPEKDVYIERDVQAVGLDPRKLPPTCCNITRAAMSARASPSTPPESTNIRRYRCRRRNTWIWSRVGGRNTE